MRTSVKRQEHIGELKLSIRGDTLADIFAGAAGFVASECGTVSGDPLPWQPVRLSARDDATLLVDWANELLGRSEVDRVAYDEMRNLRVGNGALNGEIRGRRVKSWLSPLKAATYHDLVLEQSGARWSAVLVFDV